MRSIVVIISAVALLLWLWPSSLSLAAENELQVCDVDADYYLGVEDYSEAIRIHVEVVRKHPDNAIAHYHLGFALGMVGDRTAELREYQRAAALGLRSWDLLLNLGLAQLESGDLDAAAGSLQGAVLLGGDHFEPHLNLALVDERRGMLADAERETLAAQRLNRDQPDARNLLGVIYAEEGNSAGASVVWRDLVRDVRDYEPARANLTILTGSSTAPIGAPLQESLSRKSSIQFQNSEARH